MLVSLEKVLRKQFKMIKHQRTGLTCTLMQSSFIRRKFLVFKHILSIKSRYFRVVIILHVMHSFESNNIITYNYLNQVVVKNYTLIAKNRLYSKNEKCWIKK